MKKILFLYTVAILFTACSQPHENKQGTIKENTQHHDNPKAKHEEKNDSRKPQMVI